MSKTQTLEHKEGYEKNKLGWTPEGWTVMSLGKIGEFSKGKGVAKKIFKKMMLKGCQVLDMLKFIRYMITTRIL